MRREMRFKNFEEALAEVDSLLSGNAETTGKWSFFQILDHCTWALEGSRKGVRRNPPSLKTLWVGPLKLWVLWLKGSLPVGIRNPRNTDERIEGDATAAAGRLRAAVKAFKAHPGPWSDHPLLGYLDRRGWEKFHLLHLANHLGYVRVKQ